MAVGARLVEADRGCLLVGGDEDALDPAADVDRVAQRTATVLPISRW